MKKLYLIERRDDLYGKAQGDPWAEEWGKSIGFVICANTKKEARQIAAQTARAHDLRIVPIKAWMEPKFSTCIEMDAQKFEKGEVIIQNYHYEYGRAGDFL